MTIDVIDESGKPRSDKDIEELREYLTKTMISARATTDPGLVVLIPTALDLIAELQAIRRVIRKKDPTYGR